MFSFTCQNYSVELLLGVRFFLIGRTQSVVELANNRAKQTKNNNAVLTDVQCSILREQSQTEHPTGTSRTQHLKGLKVYQLL